MSGPKVMVVVPRFVIPRQELIDACRAAIADVDRAMNEWKRIMDRNMIAAPDAYAVFQQRRDELMRLLERDRFNEVQDSASGLTAAIRRDIQDQLVVRDSVAFRKQSQARSLRFTADAVLARCREGSHELPDETLRLLGDAATGHAEDSEALRDAISRAMAVFSAQQEDTASLRRGELAGMLGATGQKTDAAEVLNAAKESFLDPRITRISCQLADLASCGDEASEVAFRSRLEKVFDAEASGNMQQYGLLLSSMEVDIAAAVRRAHVIRDLKTALDAEAVAAEGADASGAYRQHATAAKAALERADVDTARLHIDQLKMLRSARDSHRAAQASRAAILDGLKELGYEVREGMATQWAEKKQLVVRHAAKSGVALELAGNLDGGRLQARMVALQGFTRDPHADKETEETWCSELQTLRESIARTGGELRVEKALAAGAAPLKVVTVERDEDECRRDTPKERTL